MTDTAPEAPAPRPTRRSPSTRAKVAFSAGTVVVILLVLELTARIAGAGDRNAFGGSRLPYQRIYPPLYRRVPAPPVDRLRPRDPRLVDRSLPVSAANGRVFVFGESAVAALGMSENESAKRPRGEPSERGVAWLTGAFVGFAVVLALLFP